MIQKNTEALFINAVLPSFQHSLKEIFVQINEAFKTGMAECKEYNETIFLKPPLLLLLLPGANENKCFFCHGLLLLLTFFSDLSQLQHHQAGLQDNALHSLHSSLVAPNSPLVQTISTTLSHDLAALTHQ